MVVNLKAGNTADDEKKKYCKNCFKLGTVNFFSNFLTKLNPNY